MEQSQLMLGFAEADITPAGPIETIGFGRADEISRGVLHPLSAQVAVWRRGEMLCCLVTIDHIGFSREHADRLRDCVGAVLGVDRQRVMLCFSHGHASPNESAAPEYERLVRERVVQAARAAAGDLSPVSVAWGNAQTDIGLNRRPGGGPTDRRLGVLKVVHAQSGALRLLLLRLTAHCNVLKQDNYQISPDYFGTVRDVLGAKYNCPVMVTQGAAGDIAPKYYRSAIDPPDAPDGRFIRTDTALRDMADAVLRDAAGVIRDLSPTEGTEDWLDMRSRFLTLYADVPSWDRALEIAAEAREACGIDGTGWLKEVQRLLRSGVSRQAETVEVQYFTLGTGCLCGVANEILCEFALRAARALRDEKFYLNGYTNGCTGYFPTEEVFDEGGYEVYWSMLVFYLYHGRVFPLRRASAERLIRFVVENRPAP